MVPLGDNRGFEQVYYGDKMNRETILCLPNVSACILRTFQTDQLSSTHIGCIRFSRLFHSLVHSIEGVNKLQIIKGTFCLPIFGVVTKLHCGDFMFFLNS